MGFQLEGINALKPKNIKELVRPLVFFIRVHLLERFQLIVIFLTRLIFYKPFARTSYLRADKNFLFNLQYFWTYSPLELMTASQLKMMGHKVTMLICDGLPYCERETILNKRPSCKTCSKQSIRHCNAYGLNYRTLSEFLDKNDLENANTLSRECNSESLTSYQIDNLDLGEIAYRNYSHYMKGGAKINSQSEPLIRKCLNAALLIDMSTKKALNEINPDYLVTANAKFVQTAIPAIRHRQKNRSFYNYEVFGQGDGVIVDKDEIALEQQMNKVWNEIKDIRLTGAQTEKLYKSLKLQNLAISTPYKYWDSNRIDSEQEILSILKIKADKKIISCFPNVTWDSTCMGVEAISKNIDEWLDKMVQFFSQNEELHLIIRAHPGETNVPKEVQASVKVCDLIKSNYPDLPENISLIGPDDPLSSYAIVKLSHANLFWTGTLGLEICFMKLKPFTVARSYYSNKGFTTDFNSLQDLLENLKSIDKKNILTEDELRLAEVFAYNVRFNRKFWAPYYKKRNYRLYNYLNLKRKKNKTLDNLTDYFLDKKGYLGLGEFDI
jgi:hypothetical protein